jgi:orotate phosphoribosyltransferase
MPKQLTDSGNWEALFHERRIIWRYPGHGPHAIYTLSGKHSDFYFNSDYLVSDRALVKELCSALFDEVSKRYSVKPDWVVTYPPFGLNIGFAFSELFDSGLAYIKSLEESDFCFDLKAGETALFCADDLYSGKSFRTVLKALENRGVKLIEPLMVLGNFSGKSVFDGYRIQALMDHEIPLWDKEQCPLCAAGSKPLLARRHWDEFKPISV